MSSLVVYFSRSGSNWVKDGITNIEKGNTEILAEYISNKIGADILKIQTNQKYTDDYRKCTEEAKEELNNQFRPEILNCPENLDKYDTIYIGYPIWWGTFPTAVFAFLEKFNWDKQIIYPFCTHEGSGLADSVNDLKLICKNAIIKPFYETRGYTCQDFYNYNLDKKIDDWLNN